MHNKFCLIDGITVISGSYNWTYGARLNKENVIVIKDTYVHIKYLNEFHELQASSKELWAKEISPKSPFLTPLMRHRYGLARYSADENPFWIASKYASSAWITKYAWHPFKRSLKLNEIRKLDDSALRETLIINNPKHANSLHHNFICLQTL